MMKSSKHDICYLILILFNINFITIYVIYVSIDVKYINFYSLYNEKIIQYMRSLDERLYGPISVYTDLKEISYIMIIFRVYLSIVGFDESEKLCWKHEIILF